MTAQRGDFDAPPPVAEPPHECGCSSAYVHDHGCTKFAAEPPQDDTGGRVACDCTLRAHDLHRLGCPNRDRPELYFDYPQDAHPAASAAGAVDEAEESVDLTPGVVWTDAQIAVVRDLTARTVRAERELADTRTKVQAVERFAEAWTRYPQSPEDRERNRYGAAMQDCGDALIAALSAPAATHTTSEEEAP